MQSFLSRALVPTASAVLFGTKFGGDAFDLITGKPVAVSWPDTTWANFFRFGPDYVERFAINDTFGPFNVSTQYSESGVNALSVVQLYSRVVMAGANSNGGVSIVTAGGTVQPRLSQWPNTNRLGWTKYSSPNWDESSTTAPHRTTPGMHAAGHSIGVAVTVGTNNIAAYASDGVRGASDNNLSLLTGFEPRPRSSGNRYFDLIGIDFAAYRLHAVLISPFYSSGDQLAAVTQNPSALLAALHARATGRLVLPRSIAPNPRYTAASLSITARRP